MRRLCKFGLMALVLLALWIVPRTEASQTKTMIAYANIVANSRVGITTNGNVITVNAGTADIGVCLNTVTATTQLAAVQFATPGETQQMNAYGAISVGAAVYGADAGRVSTTSVGTAVGIALTASSQTGDVITVLRTLGPGK